MTGKIVKDKKEWRQLLSDEAYYVCREKGTEPAFSGKYLDHHQEGVFHCVCCGNKLFDSGDKFDSGTGWPSFTKPYSPNNVSESPDHQRGMIRTEILCARCDSHLGHVFNDGPKPGGLRYCLNSLSLIFEEKKPEN
ncbi:MAG: peptide-methionine (R)-S-oxide reductase MsrB [Deltaproteobacteria bacterium]|nr:peptide-methionine (R)-S-oxide reductase MsrB [Deltaproteobacteria bacterium]